MLDNSRQSDLIPADKLTALSVDVIGVGAIGRNVAIQATAMGVTNLRIIDFDRVDASNVASQGYFQSDIGSNKVECLGAYLCRINPELSLSTVPIAWDDRMTLRDIVFCCVDSMAVREQLFDNADDSQLFVDGRMQAEVGFVFPVSGDASRESYRATFFDDADAEPGRCTSQTTLYGASHVASAMIHQFVRHLRGQAIFACGGMVGAYTKIVDYKV